MSDDLISRQAAIDIAFRSPFFSDSLMEELRALPSVQPKAKTGQWFGTVCSACGESTSFYYDCVYCPKCGAKMEDEENE